MTIDNLIKKMTLEEKASLCSGSDFWHTEGIERLGLSSIMMTDGPHGLRKQEQSSDHLGMSESVKATCFPPACTTACSFDEALLFQLGEAIGQEASQEGVSLVLGPGTNIKRSPLCGRNFEYFSEDPFLGGKLAASMIRGMQSKGIGASLKHFAANNQEAYRMVSNSIVDMRALREIYLSGFEIAVKESQPWTVMASYNKVNGEYASKNAWLLNQVLRHEWGFEGAVVSDWGAVDDRVKSLEAGLDLEMPTSNGRTDADIVSAVKNGSLSEATLDRAVKRILQLLEKASEARRDKTSYDIQAHHLLAQRTAAESAVLLKNEDKILPLDSKASLAVIGAFAKRPRYQGAGSSLINPHKVDTACEALTLAGISYSYAPGYSLEDEKQDEETLLAEAREAAEGKDAVLIFTGLPDAYESEGFDRTSLAMPQSHLDLIEAITEVNPNTVVVLQLGSPVELPWRHKVKGILLCYLGGQAGGSACVDLLTGKSCPSGKLAESWPEKLEDTPSFHYYPGGTKGVQYRESLFVGYRFYNTAETDVAFPFGYGLSYSTFEYDDLEIHEDGVRFSVTNRGKVAASEIAQLYIGKKESPLMRPKQELKGFKKVRIEPGEKQRLEIPLDARTFSYYNTHVNEWCVEGGSYSIEVGASSRDIKLTGTIEIEGDGKEKRIKQVSESLYMHPERMTLPLVINDNDFEALYGSPLPAIEREEGETFTRESTLGQVKHTKMGSQIYKEAIKNVEQLAGDKIDSMRPMLEAIVESTPLKSMIGDEVSPLMLSGMIDMMNGKTLSGLIKLLKGKPKKGKNERK